LVKLAFDDYIKRSTENDQIGTAICYTNARNSFKSFLPDLASQDVTPELLQSYERWMLNKEIVLPTLGMYLRCLRCLFNKAIADGNLLQYFYPFWNP
jgi:hypothetical protein